MFAKEEMNSIEIGFNITHFVSTIGWGINDKVFMN